MNILGSDPTIKEKLGQIIKSNRIKSNITQSQMAVQINCDQSVVSRIENGNIHINDSIYLSALRQFNMSYKIDNQVEGIITKLISTFIHYYERESFEQLLELEQQIVNCSLVCKNILLTYDLYVLEAVLYDVKGEDEECHTLLSEVDSLIQVCNKNVRRLYTVLVCKRAYNQRRLEIMLTSIQTFLETDDELCEDPLLNYWLGVYYFLKNRRMRCLRHLHISYSYYRNRNIVKTTKITLIIVMMLVRENKVEEAIGRLEEVLSGDTTKIPGRINTTFISNLGYCYYLMNSYETAKHHFRSALNFEDTYDHYFNYYFLLKIYKDLNEDDDYHKIASHIRNVGQNSSEHILKKLSVSFHASYLLVTEDRGPQYYSYIEKHILNHAHYYFERPIRISLLKELLEYYWKHKQYKKYRNLQSELISCYA